MTTRAAAKNKNKKPLETTLGKAPTNINDDPIDLSHLRKPIDTSIFGLRQVLQLYETATNEVRQYVTYECDIMYECRMCRTIFRSLANFILHKRNYCRESYNSNDHTNCRNNCQENELRVIQEETGVPVSSNNKEQNSGSSSPIPPKCDSNRTVDIFQQTNSNSSSSLEIKENKKNLTYVLRRLQGRQQSNLITEQCLSEDISNESKSSEKEEGKNNVALEKITEATSGVFQTMFRNMIDEYKGDMMKTEVMEIHNILENNEAILGSDGKIVASESDKCATYTCTVCDQKFSTTKTLTYHIKYKHNNTRLVYQCPECTEIFANAWSVIRHLYKHHRKTTSQVKKLRNQIHANIIRRDQQPERKNGNTVKFDADVISDLQERANLENQQWMDDLEGDNDLQRCGGCGRKFERKAALHSHSQFCSKRIAICNSLKENSAKRTQSDRTKISKTISNTNVDNIVQGSRRRKQLISQKMCRIDYVKDNEVFSDNTVKDCTEDHHTKEEIHEDMIQKNECETDIIEVRDDSNNSENELVHIQNLNDLEVEQKINDGNLKPNTTTPLPVESQSFSRSESRSSDCDDVIYIDTIKLSPPTEENLNFVEPTNNIKEEIKVSPNIIKNNILTRSMRNAQKNIIQENSISLSNNFTEESASSISPQTVVAEELTITENETNFEASVSSGDCSKINDDIVEQNPSTENNKRKGTEPQPGNSKRKKDEVPTESCLIKTHKVTLETKSSQYVDNVKQICLPCKKKFKSDKSLMKHMAIHFNWYRYQCSKCSYMSYTRSKCDRHVEIKHAILDEDTLKNTILHVPHWKTIDKSTDFIKRIKKCRMKRIAVKKRELLSNKSDDKLLDVHNHDEEMEEIKEEVEKCTLFDENPSLANSLEIEVFTNIPEPIRDDIPPLQSDVQDPSLRKMIMEVIFGNQGESSDQIESEKIVEPEDETECLKGLEEKDDSCKGNSSKAEEGLLGFQTSNEVENKIENPTLLNVGLRDNARPIRNRVPTVQKDFLYDMAQILKPKPIIRDKEANASNSHKETEKKVKHKLINKTCTKETKTKHIIQLSINNNKKISVNKSVDHVQEQCATELVQDINMNSEDLKSHVTGDCR